MMNIDLKRLGISILSVIALAVIGYIFLLSLINFPVIAVAVFVLIYIAHIYNELGEDEEWVQRNHKYITKKYKSII